MSRRNQDLVSRVRFEVDSRMANATMQALQTHAEKLNQQVAEVNASIKALGDVPDDSPALLEYRKQLRRLNSDLKDVNTTMKDYTRGVKAAGELYRHYAMGNIEDMSIKAIRAGVNGMKKRYDNLKAGGDPGDAEEMRLIEAITTEADVVVKRFKTDYQHVVEEIARGGTVTEQTLKRTRDGLADLMQTAETEAEKNELTNYWQKVGAAIEAVAVENRRLRGEVADREEAMRIAYATDHDGSQQAIHDAEARADAARRENDELRQRLDLKQQQRRELEQEMDINSMQVRSLMDRRDELKAQEKEDRAIRNQRVDDANKELNAARRAAKTQQQAYDEQKQTVEKLRTEVQGLTDDIRKMGEVKAEPKIDTSELEAKLAEAKRVLGNASAFEKLAQAKLDGMRSVLNEQGTLLDSKQAELRKFTDATYDLQSRRDELDFAIEPFSRKGRSSGRYHFDIHDVEQQRVAVEKLDEAFRRLADDDYFKNASLARKYELLGTATFGYSDAEQQFGSYERAIRSLGVAAEESGAKFRLLFQGAGVDKSFQGVEFLDGYVSRRKEIAQLNAEIKKALGDTNIDELAREVDNIAGSYNKLAGEVQEQEQEVARWGKLRQEYADNAAAAERELAAAQQQSTTATAAQSEAYQKLEKQLSDAKRDLAEIAEDERKANEALKQFGITTADITDDAKLQAAAEKALKEEEESRLELAKQMLQVRKQIGQEELKDSRIVGSKDTQAFYAKNKGVLDDEYWKSEAGGGSISRMYKYLNDISDDPEAKAEFKEQVGMTVKDAMRVAGQRMREVVQEAMKRGIKIDDALSDFADGYGHGPATKIEEFMREFNETVGDKEDELIKKRREKLDAIADVVYDPGEEMASRDERLRLAKESLKGVGEGYYGNGKPLSESYKEQQAEVTRLEGEMKKLSETSQQSAQSSEQLAQKQEQLSQKTAELNRQQDKLNGMVDETVTANQRLARAEQEQTDARNAQAEAKKHEGEAVKKVEEELRGLTDEQLKNAQAYSHLTEEINADTAAMQRNITTEQEATREADRLRSGSIDKMEQALARLRESNRKLDPTIDKEEWERGERAIGQLTLRLEELKKQSAELRREPVLDMMTQRMDQLGTLSRDALTETKKFWQAMYDGADKNDPELKKIEERLRNIATEEDKRRAAQAERIIGNMDGHSDAEIKQAVQTMEQLRDAQAHGNAEWERFNKLTQEGKKYLEDWATVDSVIKYEEQMQNLPRLSDAALTETKKFWETMVAGAEKGSSELREYEAHLEKVKQEEQERKELSNEMKAQLVRTGTLGNFSESEIKESIAAAKELQSHMASASPEAKKLADAIANAEEHIKKYGIESARAAKRQKESDDTMRKQLSRMSEDLLQGNGMPSEAALKAQKRYWQQLIDDPKNAGESLQQYRDSLAEVENLMADMVKINGQTALEWFRNGSDKNSDANKIKEMADRLKAYRDTLPQESEAATIQYIDQLLQKVGASTKKATAELMDFEKAKEIALQAGDDVYGKQNPAFLASPEEIQAATKSIEKYREELFKTIKQKRDMGEATDAEEEELKELAKYLKDLKFEQDNFNMSREKMEQLMNQPVSAVSIDELRAAIKRADAELRRMEGSLGENSSEYKRFAEQVRNAKNVMKEMEGQAKASATAWEKAFNRLKTYVVMYMGFNEVWQKVTGTARDLMDLSDRMGEVRKTTGFTADEVGRLSENLKKMDVRTSLTSLMEISASAGQLGLKTLEDVQGFTEAANKLMIALPEMGREAATEMMRVAIATGEVDKIRKQLQEGTIEGSSATAVAMEKIASTIDRLRASSASTAPEITDFVKRVGAVGAQSGITIDQVAALGSTVSSLGMRIEMSATALSRMIPAIRNNAFELAKAIGVTPDTIRNLFDTGRGMEVILMILQRIKDTGMDADSVEQMLGMAGMRDIMKDLNQQGARAGIVFSGLSQNVDELRRQLGVAGEAYEENIAIQQEFDKMNETTAAKWERLKNAFEEGFVGDKPQRLLGGIIDWLRKIVDFMVGDSSISSAFRTILVYIGLVRMQLISLAAGALKSVGGGLRNIGIMLGFIKGEMTKLQWGNIFTALAGAVLYAYMAFKDLKSATEKASEALGKTKDDVARAQEQFEGYWRKLKDTSVALEQARKSHDQLSAEVDKLRNSTDKGAAATENLRKKEDELKKSEDNVAKASNDHKTAISQMNNIYGKYLGFIMTETNYANLAAAAHNKVAAAIEREMLMKQKQAAISEVDSNYSADIASNYGKLSERLTQQGLNRSQASQAMADLQRFLRKNVSYDAATNETTVSKAVTDQLKRSGLNLSKATSNEIVALWYDKYLKDTYHLSDRARMNITGVNRTADRDEGWQNVYSPFATNVRGGYADTYIRRERERGSVSAVYNADLTRVEGEEAEAASTLLQRLEKQAKDSKAKILDKSTSDKDRNDAYINLANALEGLDNRINELDPKKDAETINRLRDMAKTLSAEGISVKKLTAARREIHSTLFDRATFDENTIREAGNANPWGTSEPGESTNWKEMTAEQLVNRREQMNKFVNSLQTDTDVKAVLNEDKALKKAIEAGMSSDMRTVIEWYNTERLKIQDELHARHLTNTGDWLDPKKERGAKKQFRDEMDAYLHELDAYYTERKTRIEQARNDEEITEGEAWRRTIQNDNEWQTRRAELQKLYSRKQQEVTQEELDAIIHIIAERTGDSESFVKAAIAKTNQFVDAIEKSGDKGAAIVHRWMSQVVLDTERSYLKAAQAIGKQMKFIEDTLAKERPYDGITKNLQDNLDKMGVLAAKYRRENEELARQGKEPKYSNEQITAQSYDEMAFYLRQAADAYSIDIDELLRRMVKEGMTATAEEISKSDMLKQAVMGQLRKTYQEVQDAVKKEASQIKKDVEIIWNDDARGIGGMSMKATFDKALAQLGMQQDSVSRANSLIGAGAASDNVASRLAMKQIEVQMRMQKAQYDMYRVQANQRMTALKAEAEEHRRLAKQMEKENHLAESKRELLMATNAERDAENVRLSLGLTLAEETKKEEQQKAELLKIQEESQNRLYTSLREWADLLTSSIQGVMEASHAGDAEYYNERAKLDLTGKGGPGAGTYIVIDDAGTDDATAHYEYLDERQALERQHEIERENAMAEAWEKLWDDINMKMSEQITDWMNAALQQQAVVENTAALKLNTDAEQRHLEVVSDENGIVEYNTDAVRSNTSALQGLTQQLAQGITIRPATDGGTGSQKGGTTETPAATPATGTTTPVSTETTTEGSSDSVVFLPGVTPGVSWQLTEEQMAAEQAQLDQRVEMQREAAEKVRIANEAAFHSSAKTEKDTGNQMAKSNASTFAKMTMSANLYGIAYQAMSNDNLSATQKFEMIALQSVGNFAISSLTAFMSKAVAEGAVNEATVLGKLWSQLGWAAAPVFAIFTGLLGAAMGAATSAVSKSKSQIAQATGSSVGAGRLATGMLTYAGGNVNELTDPASLTPGRQYNVDGADGKTYRARYMGKGAKTHITNGPEFHLVGEAGREAIIDAKTTRLLQMNETGIWRDIQTLYNGGSIAGLSTRRRRGTGVRTFANGNIGEFEDMGGEAVAANGTGGMSAEVMTSMLETNSRLADLLENALVNGIKAVNKWTGSDGIPAMYNKMQKEAQRHGEKYL